ncbi:MAG: tRNA-binding protein [Candidatus Micrarchaeaceae archaeon]
MIGIEDFKKIELRVGRIMSVEDHDAARKPMYRLKLSFGELGEKTIVAGIKGRYLKDELLGKQIVCVFNLEPKNVAGIASEGMILAAEDGEVLSLVVPEKPVKDGSRVY